MHVWDLTIALWQINKGQIYVRLAVKYIYMCIYAYKQAICRSFVFKYVRARLKDWAMHVHTEIWNDAQIRKNFPGKH